MKLYKNRLRKLVEYLKARVFVNEKVIIYRLGRFRKQHSLATIKSVDKYNVRDICNFEDYEYVNFFLKFLLKGDKGYFAYLDGQCIHRSWVISDGQLAYPHWLVQYQIASNEIYVHYCATAGSAKGKNVFPSVLSHIVGENTGKKITVSVNERNIASRRSVEKVGFRQAGLVHAIMIFGLNRSKVRMFDNE